MFFFFVFSCLVSSIRSAVTEEQGLPGAAAVHGLGHRCLHLLLHAAGADPVCAGIHWCKNNAQRNRLIRIIWPLLVTHDQVIGGNAALLIDWFFLMVLLWLCSWAGVFCVLLSCLHWLCAFIISLFTLFWFILIWKKCIFINLFDHHYSLIFEVL